MSVLQEEIKESGKSFFILCSTKKIMNSIELLIDNPKIEMSVCNSVEDSKDLAIEAFEKADIGIGVSFDEELDQINCVGIHKLKQYKFVLSLKELNKKYNLYNTVSNAVINMMGVTVKSNKAKQELNDYLENPPTWFRYHESFKFKKKE